MHSRPGGSPMLRWVGTLLALVFLPAVFGLLPWHWRWLHVVPVEGVVGRLMAGLLVVYLNMQGAWVVAAALAAAGLYFASAISFWVDSRKHCRPLGSVSRAWRDRWRNCREEQAELEAAYEREARRRSQAASPVPAVCMPRPTRRCRRRACRSAAQPSSRILHAPARAEDSDPLDEIPAYQRADYSHRSDEGRTGIERSAEPSISGAGSASGSALKPESRGCRSRAAVLCRGCPATASHAVAPMQPQAALALVGAVGTWRRRRAPCTRSAVQHAGEIAIHGRADAEMRTVTVAPKNVSGFKLPPSTLLNAGEGPQAVREDELREEAKVLVEKCAEFDVRGQVVQINPGPMVTTYEFKPEAGVKYSRVTGLADDLCLAMRAESILIERMAGKSTVGIQVPNHERETIHLRDVIESETFAKARSRLTLAMGKDINGRIVTADLASMPHVLIAGSTGSGKSVAINAMIMSLLYRTTPHQVRLILVDPKRVELGMYEGIPHLFTPIITEPKLAANALRNAVREMERRLKLLASRSVRNIDQYNKLFEGSMPFALRRRSKRRAAALHRHHHRRARRPDDARPRQRRRVHHAPGADGARRRHSSHPGHAAAQRRRHHRPHQGQRSHAHQLPPGHQGRLAHHPRHQRGRGAAWPRRHALPAAGNQPPDAPARALCERKRDRGRGRLLEGAGQAEYVEGFLESPKDERAAMEGANADASENDPMFDDAVRLVFEFGKASTSLLQRRLRIGYGRAAHLIDLMERDGLVGAADGPRPRELLKAPGWLHEVAANQ